MPEPKNQASILSSSLLQEGAEQSAAIVTSKGVVAADLALLLFFIKQNSFTGVILCVDRPASFYMKTLEAHGVSSKGMRFISVGFKETGENITNIGENAGDLTFMKIELVRTAQKMRLEKPGAKLFLLNDAVTTLILYNEEKVVGQFLHDLNNKLRELNVYQITILEPGEKMATLVEKLADVVVEMG